MAVVKKKTTRKKTATKKKAPAKKAVLEEKIDALASGDNLSTDWFMEDKTPEDRRKTREVLLNSTIQFRLLKKILEKLFSNRSVSKADLDKPNLDLRMVYNEGYKEALQEIYRLLP